MRREFTISAAGLRVRDAGTHFGLTTATSSLQFARKLTGIRLAKQLEPFDIAWFEEPVSPDDHAG